VLASVAASAQVYSVNAVGFVNVTVPPAQNAQTPGLALVANQLNAAPNNAVSNLLAGVPEETVVYKYTPGTGFSVNAYQFGAWANPGQTLNPGEGAFISNPGTTELRITFVGEVPQGSLSTPLVAGLQIVSSQVPQAGRIDTAAGLSFPVADDDIVFKWDKALTAYEPSYAYVFGAWEGTPPRVPNLVVGEAFFVNKSPTGLAPWTRTFSVNQ
jgi:hypothetical protein